jgi:putative toxin-antitoxin system antitoxin component (TIGR02293 family)
MASRRLTAKESRVPVTRGSRENEDPSIVLEAILSRAIEVIGNEASALRWLSEPVRKLNYATPISLLGTPEGEALVEEVLGQMEHGVW